MRVKTDERRHSIIDAAIEVFRAEGYERASMSLIAARLGGSKTTLYGYFASKEELFAAAMGEALRRQADKEIGSLDAAEPDVALVLQRFGAAYNRLVTSEDALAVTRVAVAEGANQELGPMLYAQGPRRVLDTLTPYFAALIAKRVLRNVDARVAAAHLQALLDAGILLPRLFGAKQEFKTKDAVRAAVEAFLSAYRLRE